MQRLLRQDDLSRVELASDWPTLQSHLAERLIRRHDRWEWRQQHRHELARIAALARRTDRSDPPVPLLIAHVAERLPDMPAGPERRNRYQRKFMARQIASDLVFCAENRACNGLAANFWEMLFQTYRAGLWPCGWQGTWPAPGNLIAWRPAT
jgi:hypothetical protein